MSNLWFNIRIGMTHFIMTSDWKFSAEKNTYHKDNPKKFEVYTLFGKHFI